MPTSLSSSDLNPCSGSTTTLFSPFRHDRGSTPLLLFAPSASPGGSAIVVLLFPRGTDLSEGQPTNLLLHVVRNRLSKKHIRSQRVEVSGMVSHLRALFDVWFSLHIVGGHFLVPVLIVTFLFSKAKRDATLINCGITLSLSSVFNCLLSVSFSFIHLYPPSLTHLLQDSTQTNTLDPNQTKHCASFKPQHLAHAPPCPSFPILSWPIPLSTGLRSQVVSRCLGPSITNKVKSGT